MLPSGKTFWSWENHQLKTKSSVTSSFKKKNLIEKSAKVE